MSTLNFVSWKTISLAVKLTAAATTLTATTDLWIDAWRLYFKNNNQVEWIDFTWVSANWSNFDYTWLTRWLSQTTDWVTGWTGKTWLATETAVNVQMHDQAFNRQKPKSITFATTATRDTALWADWVATEPYVNVYVTATWLYYNYNLSSAQWETIETWTATPNASETAAGKIELATDAQLTAWTDTWETWAKLTVIPSQLQKSINLQSAILTSSAEADLYSFEDVTDNKNKKQTKANLRDDLAASTTLKWTVELATDVEATAWTDETRYINSKQTKDNYWQVWNLNWDNDTFADTSAHNWTLTIALWESSVETVFLSGYLYMWDFNNPTWTKKKLYFAWYFKLTTSPAIDFNPIVNTVVDTADNTNPSDETLIEESRFQIDTGASKVTATLTTSAISWDVSTMTWVYIDWTDLKVDYVIDAHTWATSQGSWIFIWPVTIIN